MPTPPSASGYFVIVSERSFPCVESALVVEVPAAERIVRKWRERYDPAAGWGVPAHITVLYPFLPPDVINPVSLERMRRVVDRLPAFDLELIGVAHFGDDVLFLEPHPAERFVEMTAAVVTEWPEYKPYGGAYDEVIPHLTVADSAGRDHFDEIGTDLARRLPIRCHVDTVSLMTGSFEPASWRTVVELSLG